MVVLVDGFSLFLGIIINGSLDGGVELLHLVNNIGEGLLREAGGNLDEGKDWVG